MKMPKSVKIGPHVYAIETLDASDGDLMNMVGVCSNDHLRIRINTQMPLSRQAETIVHEIVHAVLALYGDGDKKHVDEESLTERLDTGLYQVIVDNPLLMAWIISTKVENV